MQKPALQKIVTPLKLIGRAKNLNHTLPTISRGIRPLLSIKIAPTIVMGTYVSDS